MTLLALTALAGDGNAFTYLGAGVNVGASEWSGLNAANAAGVAAQPEVQEAYGDFGAFGGLSLGAGVAGRFFWGDFGLSRGRTGWQGFEYTVPGTEPPRVKRTEMQLRPQMAWVGGGLGHAGEDLFLGVGVGLHMGRVRDATRATDTWAAEPDSVSRGLGGDAPVRLLPSLEARLTVELGELAVTLAPALVLTPPDLDERGLLRVAVLVGPSDDA